MRRVSLGKTPVQRLIARREEINPALRMAWRLQQRALTDALSLPELMEMASEIEGALERGQKMQTETTQVLSRLKGAEGIPFAGVPEGF